MNPQQPPYQPYPPQQGWQPGPGAQPSGGYPFPQPTGGYQQPTGQPWPPMPPAPAPKKHRKWPWIVTGLVVFLLLIMIIGAGGSKTANPTSTASTSAPGSATSAQPAAVAAAPVPAPAPQPAAPPKAITARDWAKIAKDPDSHVGEAIIVYGEVTQFDSATGTGVFRANVDGVKHQVSYGFADYPTNTVLSGDGSALGDLVQGDLFKAEAVVAGSLSYETTMGGNLSAPKLTVSKVTVIGSTK
jgi:hypothetical protein